MSHHRRRKLHKSISCQLFKTILHVEYLLYDVPMFILDVKVSPQGLGQPTGELTRPSQAGQHSAHQNFALVPKTTRISSP